MIRRLIILLLIVGCEENGITSNGLTDGTAVTDTLYIFNYDTLIFTNYDTTIVNNYDTLIITNYDTTIVYDSTTVIDTVFIEIDNHTTREIIIPVDKNTQMIDINNYVGLVSGFYIVDYITVNVINNTCSVIPMFQIKTSISTTGVSYIYGFDGINGSTIISYENSNLILAGNTVTNCEYNLELTIWVTGLFNNN